MLELEQQWAQGILASFAPPDGPGLAPRTGEVDYMPAFVALLTGAAPLSRVGLRLALWLVALSPLFVLFRPRTFMGLAPHERTALLGRLLEHRSFALRESTFLMKTAACLALLGSDTVRERSLYDGAPRAQPDARKALPVVGGDA
jgi:hypothetical protein